MACFPDGQEPLALTDFHVQVAQLFFSLPEAAGSSWLVAPAGGEAPDDPTGAALNVRQGLWPLNGLRHSPAADTCGWYIWAGEEFFTDVDFSSPPI